MSTRRSLAVATALLLGSVLGLPARAEVTVETDAFGNYVRTAVLTQASIRQVKIWRVVRRHIWKTYTLNPEGDRNGDQFPAVAENPADGRHPWAVWSRFNGSEFDLAWSRWRPGGWTTVQFLAEDSGSGDDLAPQVAFDSTGRPYVVWWRDEGGTGRVYLSFYLLTHWMTPFAVSDNGVDSRNPRLQFDGGIRIDYQTAAGPESRIVTFAQPTTITDDVNPFNQLRVQPAGSGGPTAHGP